MRLFAEVPHLAARVVCSHGAVVNIDFSASDCRQLTKGRRTKANARRTLGSVTGINDVPLLPPLFETSERQATVEKICFATFHLLKKENLRPIGFNTDDIEKWFQVIVGCLRAVFPALVREIPESKEAEAKAHLAAGGIVVNVAKRSVRGFELGQDALHWYYRLLASLNCGSQDPDDIECLRIRMTVACISHVWVVLAKISSDSQSPTIVIEEPVSRIFHPDTRYCVSLQDAVLAIRSLRKLLGSLNPAVRRGGSSDSEPGLLVSRALGFYER